MIGWDPWRDGLRRPPAAAEASLQTPTSRVHPALHQLQTQTQTPSAALVLNSSTEGPMAANTLKHSWSCDFMNNSKASAPCPSPPAPPGFSRTSLTISAAPGSLPAEENLGPDLETSPKVKGQHAALGGQRDFCALWVERQKQTPVSSPRPA